MINWNNLDTVASYKELEAVAYLVNLVQTDSIPSISCYTREQILSHFSLLVSKTARWEKML